MNDKTKEYLINQIRAIQAQLELLLFFVDSQTETTNIKSTPKKETKPPFQGQKGVCDHRCDDSDVMNLTTFGGPNRVECTRCGLTVENDGKGDA